MLPHRGTTILVLGILGSALCTLIAPFAWSMANIDLRRIEVGEMDAEGRQFTQIGRILGIVGSVVMVVQLAALTTGLLLGALGGLK